MKSALANAVKRKTHKERSQLASRQKYGLLEKHKDYVKRAKDFHRKEKAIKVLKRKAEERNPDEFYFSMEKKRTKDGVHDGRLNEANKYTQEELALMRSQDAKYLAMKAHQEAKRIERLQGTLHFIGTSGPAPGGRGRRGGGGAEDDDEDEEEEQPRSRGGRKQHVVFVDTPAEVKRFDAAAHFDTPKELLGRTFNRPRTQQLEDPTAVVMPRGQARKTTALTLKAEKRKLASYNELQQRIQRQKSLARTAQHLEFVKQIAGKGRKRKLSKKELQATAKQQREGGANVPLNPQGRVFKWKRERRR